MRLVLEKSAIQFILRSPSRLVRDGWPGAAVEAAKQSCSPSSPPMRGCSAAREAVVPALAVVPTATAPSRSRSNPPARRRHGPTVRGALRTDQDPGHTRTSRLQLGRIVAVSAGQGPWEACTTSRRRTFWCRTRRRNWASSRRSERAPGRGLPGRRPSLRASRPQVEWRSRVNPAGRNGRRRPGGDRPRYGPPLGPAPAGAAQVNAAHLLLASTASAPGPAAAVGPGPGAARRTR